jgi:hypothetical protein
MLLLHLEVQWAGPVWAALPLRQQLRRTSSALLAGVAASDSAAAVVVVPATH